MHCALTWIVTRHRGQRYNVFSIGLNLIKRNKLLVALLMWQPALGFMSLENCSIRRLYAFVTFKLKTEAALALSLFTPAVCHSPKYDSSVTPESRTAAQKLLTAVFEVNEISEPPRPPSDLLKGSESAKWLRRTLVMGLTFWSGEREGGLRTESPLCCPGWNFVLEKCLTFSNPNCAQWGASSLPLPTGLATALTPGPEEGGRHLEMGAGGGVRINRMAACLLHSVAEVKLS